MITIYLIRHGKTSGNLAHRYVGRTDEALCETGKQELYQQLPMYEREFFTNAGNRQPKIVYVSPMLRCRQTAELLFSGIRQQEVSDLREMDFGEFEYKNYQELSGDVRYQAFIDSGGTTDFPKAETQQDFRLRVTRAFSQCVKEIIKDFLTEQGAISRGQLDDGTTTDLIRDQSHSLAQTEERQTYVFVVHGGTIMAILDAYASPHRDYFEWQVPAGAGYVCDLYWRPDGFSLKNVHSFGMRRP